MACVLGFLHVIREFAPAQAVFAIIDKFVNIYPWREPIQAQMTGMALCFRWGIRLAFIY